MTEEREWTMSSGWLHWEVYDTGAYLNIRGERYKLIETKLMANGTHDVCFANINGQLLIKKIVDVDEKNIVHIPQHDIAIFTFERKLPPPFCGKYLTMEIDEQLEPFIRHIVNRFPHTDHGIDYEMYGGKNYYR